jgi:integrase
VATQEQAGQDHWLPRLVLGGDRQWAKRRYASGKNKSETRAALNKAKGSRKDDFLSGAGTATLGEYLDGWLEDTRGTVRQRTWEHYEQIVRVHIKPTLGRAKLKTLNPAQVRALYRARLDGG